ncbi:MAG: hypothetical protein HY905_01680 [Deltaproteobacteria bacterium]|nr:hypothetical protein [Deltaproteobacteria bacterium]
MRRRGERSGSDPAEGSGRPWYAHDDRWEISVQWRESAGGRFLVVEPKRCDPVFGPQVEVRLRDRIEVYVCSNEDDGRYVVPLSADAARRLERDLEKTLTEPRPPGPPEPSVCPTCARDLLLPPKPSLTVPGLPRPLWEDEGSFLLRALRHAATVSRSGRPGATAHDLAVGAKRRRRKGT